MKPEDLDIVPWIDLMAALRRRDGLSIVIAAYDHKAESDGCPNTYTDWAISSGSLPVRLGLGEMIKDHLEAVKESNMQARREGEE